MLFSRFSHHLECEDSVALFNALKLKPVYVNFNNYSALKEWLAESNTSEFENVPSNLRELVTALIESRVLIESADFDNAVIKAFQDKIPTPYIEIAYFILTERCNLSCDYCFVKREYPDGYVYSDMTLETAESGLDMFCNLIKKNKDLWENEKNIILYGGEPLLNKEVAIFIATEVVRRKDKGTLPAKTSVSMITNGTLLDKETIKILNQAQVSIAISIDGNDQMTSMHRCKQSGGSVYSAIWNSIELCRSEQIEPSFSVTLTPENLKEGLLSFLLEELKVNSVGFNTLLTDSCFTVPDWYAERAAEFLISAFKEFRKRGIYEDRMMRKVSSFCEGEVYYFDCGACGGNQIVVAPDGQVGICHGYLGSRQFFNTDVNSKSFDPETSPVYMEWNRRTPINMQECQDCLALGICGGGCPLNAQKSRGSIWDIDERFCIHARKTIEWMIWDLYKNRPNENN